MFLLSKLSGNSACKVYMHITCMTRVITNGGRKKQKYNTMKEKIISEERLARLKIHIVALTTKMSLKKGKATSNKLAEEKQYSVFFSFQSQWIRNWILKIK